MTGWTATPCSSTCPPPQETLDADLYFIDRIGLAENLSPTRSNGLVAMVKQMRLYALAFRTRDQLNNN